MTWLKQSTAVTIVMPPMLDSTDGNTPETGLTISQADIRLSKNGGAYAQTNNVAGATHMEVGNYSVPLDTTDTATLGILRVSIHESGALAVWREFTIVPPNVYDSLVLSTDKLQTDVRQWKGTDVSFPDVAGIPNINITHLRGTYLNPTVAGVLETNVTHLLDTAWLTPGVAGTPDVNAKLLGGTTQTGNDVGADVNAILADTGTDGVLLAATATSAQLVDDVWDELLTGATHNIANSAGRRVREIGAFAIHSGTAQAGASNSITLAATANGGDGIYNRNLIVITDNTGVGQTRTIVDYNNTTKVVVVDRDWRITPDNTTVYQIVPDNTPLTVDHGVAQGGTPTTITIRDYASSVDDVYLCNQIAIVAGTGRGQVKLVGAYDGTTKVVTICGANWVTTPDTTSIYVMMPYGTTCTNCVGDSAQDQIVAAIIAGVADGSYDLQEMMRIMFAALSGKSSGGGTTTLTFQDPGDAKARITATVNSSGDRTAMTLDTT